MNIPKLYNPSEIEDKWYSRWMENKLFHSEPNEKTPFTIVIPPPNVTGVLHMGHLLNNTIQDLLARRARMKGFNTCWVPGTDHASIATEAKVVEMLRSKGIKKSDLSREEFLEHAWEWTEKYGGIILKQLRKLGASCDWDRTRFTMEDDLYRSVIKVFVDLHKKGYIYKAERMVNWDTKAKTALSDEEVIHKQVNSKLYHVAYYIPSEDSTITIATTRPETILGDTAICVHPEDDRYRHLVGKKAVVPLVEREIPIIADEYVDREFGTGALKITPAHDPNDYELGKKHKLDTIDILNDDGTLSPQAEFFIGQDRFEARENVAKALETNGQLVKVEDLSNQVGFSERTDSVIEPRLSLQWFLKMKELAKPALENVLNDQVEFFPKKFQNIYRHWMENIENWCISRQLWWGQQIPAYYLPDNTFVVAESREEALKMAREKSGNPDLQDNDLRQDEDVLDTWFSSWLWPMTVFNGILEPDNKEINYYYPTSVLVTAPDIIFFWVARMIMAGYEYRDEKPFNKVYYTGMVRDKQGRKMSKSLGNSPDLLQLIEENGADAVRFGALISSPAGNDLLFDEKLIDQGKNFSNKIWNALRLVKSWKDNDKISDTVDPDTKERYNKAISLFTEKYRSILATSEKDYETFRISSILTDIYKLFWDDFCSRFLEWVKPSREENMDSATYQKVIEFFELMLKLLHPFMPFVTEEIYQQLGEREKDDFITISDYPAAVDFDAQKLEDYQRLTDLTTALRNFKTEQNISPRELPEIQVKTPDPDFFNNYLQLIKNSAGIGSLTIVEEMEENPGVIVVGKEEILFLLEEDIDTEGQLEKLEEELSYTMGFLTSVQKKLNNAGFVKNARPDIVEKERQKQKDAEEKIGKLKENIKRLKDLN